MFFWYHKERYNPDIHNVRKTENQLFHENMKIPVYLHNAYISCHVDIEIFICFSQACEIF